MVKSLAGAAFLSAVAVPPASAAVQATYYASPTGSGTTCSQTAPCSLTAARDKVRLVNTNMTGDIVVSLAGGTYQLASTFTLTESGTVHDSGTNGHNVVYQAAAGARPVLSGGQSVTGWSVFDSAKSIYRAPVSTSLDFRQLYINGVRASRASGTVSGWSVSANGYTTTNTTVAGYGNVGAIEVVARNSWKEFRCGIASITGTAVTMDQPCWSNSRHHSTSMGAPAWIENAYELLDTAAEWYLDRAAGYLYYKPRTGENLTSASVVAPLRETLVKLQGSLDTPLHNVTLKGLTFSYATWLRPNTTEGYASLQGGFNYFGDNRQGACADNSCSWFETKSLYKTPGNVTLSVTKNVTVERNTFTHLGAAALSLEYGSQDNDIVGNVFTDVSGSGVEIGHMDDQGHPADARSIVKNNTVANNYITDVGAEYHDAVGIIAGYTDGSVIENNEIFAVPYSGVSIGWGWGAVDAGGANGWTTATVAKNNIVRENKIHDIMRVLNDGGAVYTLGAQSNSYVSNNYIYNQHKHFAALYFDQGTRYFTVNNNVVADLPSDIWWIFFQSISPQAVTNTASGNWTSSTYKKVSSGNTFAADNQEGLTSWPTAAQAVIDASGVEATYRDMDPRTTAVPHPQPAPVVIDDNNAAITYSSGWTAQSQSGNSDATVHWSSATSAGATAQYTFTGTSITWLAKKNAYSGTAKVYIDGVLDATVSTYSASESFQQAVYTRSGLTPGAHTIKIESSGAGTGGYYSVHVDGFRHTPVATVDDNQAATTYAGTWTLDTNSGNQGSTVHWSSATVPGASATLSFAGTSVSWIAKRNQYSGTAKVYIDGVLDATVNTYSASESFQQTVYTKANLAAGNHTIKIVSDAAGAGGYYSIHVDALLH
ncbi:MAG TPA: right-handed parallel beta-helix repeat-containing protein [Actinokineospora sp.]|jgi:hypothetical protein|nr:right-handed parallel beta-helix repeat-containing protein [Actinokineospora sp.]